MCIESAIQTIKQKFGSQYLLFCDGYTEYSKHFLKVESKNLAALWLSNSCLSPQCSFLGSIVLPVSPEIAWPEPCGLLPIPFSSHRDRRGRVLSSGVLGAASLGSPRVQDFRALEK